MDEFSRFCKFLEAREMTRAKLLIKALEQFRPQKARPEAEAAAARQALKISIG